MYKDKILNSKEKKQIFKIMKEQWDTDTDILRNFAFIKKPSGKIFISNIEAASLEQELDLKVYSIGNYFAKEEKESLRMSIEGSQIIGPNSKKNVIDLSKEQIEEWIMGNNVTIPKNFKGYCLVKNLNDFFGCGIAKEGTLLNHIPKTRRIKNIIK